MRPKRSLLAAPLLAAALLLPASSAQGAVTCSLVGSELTVRMSTALDISSAERFGDNIFVRANADVKPCTGDQATVNNVDAIHFIGAPGGGNAVIISLVGGPLAPGVSLETDTTSEIEIDLQLPDGIRAEPELVAVIGARDDTPGGPDDVITLGDVSRGHPGINLNAGEEDAQFADADVIFTSNVEPGIITGSGADRVTAAGGPGFATGVRDTLPILAGGRGPDRLKGGPVANVLVGGTGRDLLRGGPGFDYIEGGRSADRLGGFGGVDALIGNRGRDVFHAGKGADDVHARDRLRDRVNCGPGRDRIIVDRKDRLRKCEQPTAHTAARSAAAKRVESLAPAWDALRALVRSVLA